MAEVTSQPTPPSSHVPPTPSSATARPLGTPGLVGVSLAYFMVLLDITVLAVAEPDIIRGLRTDVIGVGWATASYTISLAASLVLAGAITDRFGARRTFLLGVVGFAAASLTCSVSPNIGSLIVARGVLGLCAAAILPSLMALIAGAYSEPGPRARAIAVWASISGAAMAAGPVLGGALVGVFGWRAVFVVNLPIAVLVLLLRRRGGPAGAAAGQRRIDPWPHLLLAFTLVTATLAITEAGQGHPVIAAAATAAAVSLGLGTIYRERRSRAPIVPLALRANTAAWLTFAWGGAVNLALTTLVFTLPLSLHVSPVVSGAILLPMTLMLAFSPLLTGRIIAAKGPHLPIRVGLLTLAVGTAATAAVVDGGASIQLEVALLVCGLGISWVLPALVAYAVGNAPADVAGSVGGILNATRQAGATIGAAISGAFITTWSAGAGASTALVVAAVVTFLAAGSAWMRRHLAR